MDLFLKAVLGALAVVLIQLFAQTRNYYLAGLVPLFPTFALISHYLVGTRRTTPELQQTILFGMWSLVPYFLYLAALYYLVTRCRLVCALCGATGVWLVAALMLIVFWQRTGM